VSYFKVLKKTILVLGGYGNFGKRIVEGLLDVENVTLLIAGRSQEKAKLLAGKLQSETKADLKAIALDIDKAGFRSHLEHLSPNIVIHTCGPFQDQGYHVAEACIAVGAHYVDLADDRRFVCDIKKLHDLARRNSVLIISGASSVPGLSSTVVDFYRSHLTGIENINIAIAPGNKAERGEATVKAILSCTGHSFFVFRNGKWQKAYGWMQARKVDFGEHVGKRWLANVDVPDLELFPERYSIEGSVRFQAGLELPFLHLSMVAMAFLVKIRLIKNWSPFTKTIMKLSELFLSFGTDRGCMQVEISGIDHDNKRRKIKWSLYAPNGIGPYIPTISTIIVAKKILSGKLGADQETIGAFPCQGFYTLKEFEPFAEKHGIAIQDEIETY
jgi:saccharopine dehydrogenase-like NADP-dependent oxidoreductase